ncbi:uncharacterized protein A4U43_C04F29220 [Asparagus officinalis]|uniref:Uncharacterized protein n=1 Tax=Asparagus officinalis TaxID=4686 RepID=A0A5P1F696_ASPOF|nr:uncharacterized protein A4U43_C04F29220 [Asparagus officinalis]
MESLSSSRDANMVIVALDATRERTKDELRLTMNGIRMRGDILRGGSSVHVFGVLHTVNNPMGYPMKATTDSFVGTSSRLLEEEVLKKIDMYESMLVEIARSCREERVSMNVKITAGTPTKQVILQEVMSSKAAWLILDRKVFKRRSEDSFWS